MITSTDAGPFPLLVTSAYADDAGDSLASRARASLARHEIPGFVATADPAAARAILFLESHPDFDPFYLAVLRHPLVRRHPAKCLVCHDHDFVAPFLPGFYCSLRRADHRPGEIESWIYLNQHSPNPAIRPTPLGGAEPFLYSFVGSTRTHPVRREIMRLAAPDALLEDTSGINSWQISPAARRAYHEKYASGLSASRYVLCPRGAGPNSYRIYEAMQAGRVPVIISDHFVAPTPLPWPEFALFVAEADISTIPARLAAHAPLAAAMGLAARRAWEEWCVWPSSFARLCAAIAGRSVGRRSAHPYWSAARLVCTSQSHARLLARSLRHRRRRQASRA